MDRHQTYETDAYARTLATTVIKVSEEGGRHCAILEDTILYPEGGGQPCDLGTIGEAAVLGVAHGPGGIVHFTDRPLEPGPVEVCLDWGRRRDHMQQHTGQHLLTALAQDRFGWATTAFHLGTEVCDIELDAPQILDRERLELEDAVAAEISAGRAVTASWVSRDEYDALHVRSRGLPEGHEGDIRLVAIEGLDTNTCGGTHLARTSELEGVKLLGVEPIRGGTRLFFVFGKRLRARLEAHEKRNHHLRTALGRPDDGLAEAVEQRLAREKDLERALRHADTELASAYAKAMLAGTDAFITHHFESKDAAFLQKLTRVLLDAEKESNAAGRLYFFTAEMGGERFFSLAAGGACKADLPALGRSIAAILGGRGGGSSRQFQGKFSDIGKLADARDMVAAALP